MTTPTQIRSLGTLTIDLDSEAGKSLQEGGQLVCNILIRKKGRVARVKLLAEHPNTSKGVVLTLHTFRKANEIRKSVTVSPWDSEYV